jgi:hypothetical protein
VNPQAVLHHRREVQDCLHEWNAPYPSSAAVTCITSPCLQRGARLRWTGQVKHDESEPPYMGSALQTPEGVGRFDLDCPLCGVGAGDGAGGTAGEDGPDGCCAECW